MQVHKAAPGYAFGDWVAFGHVYTLRCIATGTAEIQRLTRSSTPAKIALIAYNANGTIIECMPHPDTGDLYARLRPYAESILHQAVRE